MCWTGKPRGMRGRNRAGQLVTVPPFVASAREKELTRKEKKLWKGEEVRPATLKPSSEICPLTEKDHQPRWGGVGGVEGTGKESNVWTQDVEKSVRTTSQFSPRLYKKNGVLEGGEGGRTAGLSSVRRKKEKRVSRRFVRLGHRCIKRGKTSKMGEPERLHAVIRGGKSVRKASCA